MDEPILNQDEIKELLKDHSANKLEVTGLWEGDCKDYNIFGGSANLEVKLQLVDELHERLVKNIASTAAEECVCDFEGKFISNNLKESQDFIASINFDHYYIFHMKNTLSESEGMILFERKLFSMYYSKVLGGVRVFEKDGALTNFEMSFLDEFRDMILGKFNGIWKNQGKFEFKIQDFIQKKEKLNNLDWTFSGFESVMEISYEEHKGSIITFFPNDLLTALGEDAIEGLGEEDGGPKKDIVWENTVKAALGSIQVEVAVELGQIRLPLEKVLELEPGDETLLGHLGDVYQVLVNGIPWFKASIGSVDGFRAIQIVQ